MSSAGADPWPDARPLICPACHRAGIKAGLFRPGRYCKAHKAEMDGAMIRDGGGCLFIFVAAAVFIALLLGASIEAGAWGPL
jgi:uncharacterized protein (DUF983 family)